MLQRFETRQLKKEKDGEKKLNIMYVHPNKYKLNYKQITGQQLRSHSQKFKIAR